MNRRIQQLVGSIFSSVKFSKDNQENSSNAAKDNFDSDASDDNLIDPDSG